MNLLNADIIIIKKLCLAKNIPFQETNKEYQADFFTGKIVPALPQWNGDYLELPRKIQTNKWFLKACHEIAHWLISDPERRQYYDFGLNFDGWDDLKKPHQKSVLESDKEEYEVVKLAYNLSAIKLIWRRCNG